jgi:hypothetical protein
MIMNLKTKNLERIRRFKMSYKKLFLVVVLLFAVSSLEIQAGGRDRVGTAGASELLIPIGARGTALGGSFITSASGVEALFWNPAGVSGSDATDVMFSHLSYIADIGVSAFAINTTFGEIGTFGFSLRTLSFGDIPWTDEYSPDISNVTFSPTYTTVGITYSKALSDRIRAGLTLNLINETIANASASGFGFDVGIQYFGLAGVRGLKLGLVVKNIGTSMKFDGGGLYRPVHEDDSENSGAVLRKIDAAEFELPSYFEIGLGYDLALREDTKLSLATSFQNNNFSSDLFKLSAECMFMDLLFVRGSYEMPADDDEYLYGPAFGAGLHYNAGGLDMTLDYAYRVSKVFDGNHVITIKLGF